MWHNTLTIIIGAGVGLYVLGMLLWVSGVVISAVITGIKRARDPAPPSDLPYAHGGINDVG